MAAKRARALAKKSVASSPKLAPKMAKAAAKPLPKKASAPAKAGAKKAEPVKVAAKKAAPAKPAKKAEPMKKAAAVKVAAKKAAPAKPLKAAAKKAAAAKPVAKTPEATPKKASAAAKVSASNGKAMAPKAKAPRASKPAKEAHPEANGTRLAAGDAVPVVDLSDHEGNPFSLSSLDGQAYVLYFYPKDDTPGCTREACAFRDDLGKFEGQGVRVIGISPDKPESHTKFREKYGLPFTLLSDTEKAAANAFGVWVKKQNYGREYMGIERSTFLVGADGKVKKVWHNVKVDGHAQSVLDAAAS